MFRPDVMQVSLALALASAPHGAVRAAAPPPIVVNSTADTAADAGSAVNGGPVFIDGYTQAGAT